MPFSEDTVLYNFNDVLVLLAYTVASLFGEMTVAVLILVLL